jgi:LPXTG-motif cell wall-anchored protein
VWGVYVVGSNVYAATGVTALPAAPGGLSISTNGGANFTNKTTHNGLGNNDVFGVYAFGSNVYAATDGGLSISTDGGASFTNKTTADGLGSNIVYGVYVDGSNVYAATDGGLSISADCASPPILPETGADPSLVLVGSGMSALLLFVGAAAILASRRKRATD